MPLACDAPVVDDMTVVWSSLCVAGTGSEAAGSLLIDVSLLCAVVGCCPGAEWSLSGAEFPTTAVRSKMQSLVCDIVNSGTSLSPASDLLTKLMK